MNVSNTFVSCDVDADGWEDDPDGSETDHEDTEGVILADMMEEAALDEGDTAAHVGEVDLMWELPVRISMTTNHYPSDFP